jgi:hypothetical protein
MAAATFALGGADAEADRDRIGTIAPTVNAGGASTHLSASAAFRLGAQAMRHALPEIHARWSEFAAAGD